MRKIPAAVRLAFLVGILATPAAAKFPSMPKALQGIWFADNVDGRASCATYTAALKSGGLDAARNHLVGAEVISRKIVHSYAEYGEGNFYQPTSIRNRGKKAWTLKTRVGFDQMPGGEHTGSAEFKLSLRGEKLGWLNISYDGKPSDRTEELALRRCADAPAKLYGG
jgi:hypothetical protein